MEDGLAAAEPDVLDSRRAGRLVIQGGVLRGAGFVVNTLLALAGIALVTRHLGVVGFGRFQTVISLITVVGTITDAGLATLGLREFAQRQGSDRQRLMDALLGMRLVLTLAGAAIAAAVAAAVGYSLELVVGTALAGIGLSLTVVQTTLTIPLAAEMRNLALTLVDLLRHLLTLAGYALLVLLGAGVVAFLGVTVPVGVVLVAVVAYLVRGRFSVRATPRFTDWKPLLRAGTAFAMATAVGTLYLYMAQILTAALTDERETGLFAASFRVFIVGAMIPGLLITVAFPLLSRAARDDTQRLSYAVQRLLDTTAILGLGAAIGLVVGAPFVIDVMAGQGFDDAVPSLRIQGVTLVAAFVTAPMGFALLSLHAHRAIVVANVCALLAVVASVAVLVPRLGPEGAALATVIAETTLAVIYFAQLWRVAPEVRPGGGVLARATAAALPCAALALVSELAAWQATALSLALYVLLLAVFRAIPDELVELVPRRRRR